MTDINLDDIAQDAESKILPEEAKELVMDKIAEKQ
jgi:hypothetical protein